MKNRFIVVAAALACAGAATSLSAFAQASDAAAPARANHFRQMDAAGSGRVSFADVQRYMQARSSTSQQ